MITIQRSATDLSSIEGRLAARLAGVVNVRAQAVPHDISERLRVAREQAITRARVVRAQAGVDTTVLGISRQRIATLGRFAPWGQRFASAMPLAVLVCGMLMIERWNSYEEVLAAAEIDTQLLSDSLPPSAYSDPGFAEFLKDEPAP